LSKVDLNVEILFTSSKTLEPRYKEITFDKYKIRTIPTIRSSLNDTAENFLLEFHDIWEENQRHSLPDKEGAYILSLLSVILESKIEFNSLKINNIQGTLRENPASFLTGKLEIPPNLDELFKKLQSMDMDLLRQYLRSCNAYRTALTLLDDNPTLSFFLLVTAIEAISGKVIKKGDRENFVEFILAFLPKSFEETLGDKELLLLLINQAYQMRCAFTHGGTDISIGSLSADKTKRDYVKHYIQNKEVYSPSIRWFEKVVNATLLNFLEQQKIATEQETKLSALAREEAVIYVKAAKVLQLGRVLTTEDVDLDFKKKSD
jgi:hypothetical protein